MAQAGAGAAGVLTTAVDKSAVGVSRVQRCETNGNRIATVCRLNLAQPVVRAPLHHVSREAQAARISTRAVHCAAVAGMPQWHDGWHTQHAPTNAVARSTAVQLRPAGGAPGGRGGAPPRATLM